MVSKKIYVFECNKCRKWTLLNFAACHICGGKNEYYSPQNALSVSPRDEEGAVEKLGMLQFEMDEAFPQASKIFPTMKEP